MFIYSNSASKIDVVIEQRWGWGIFQIANLYATSLKNSDNGYNALPPVND